MACQTLPRVSYNDSTGAFVQLGTHVGEIELYLFSWAAIVLVTNQTSAANALTAFTAGNCMELSNVAHRLVLDPSTTWVRGYSTANLLSIMRQQ